MFKEIGTGLPICHRDIVSEGLVCCVMGLVCWTTGHGKGAFRHAR